MKKLVFAIIAAVFVNVQPGQAAPAVGQIRQQAIQDIQESWDCSDSTRSKTAKFTFYINAYDEAVSVSVTESSNDDQYDAECAEAVISHKPLRELLPNVHYANGLRPAEVVFSSAPKYAGEDIKKYRQKRVLSKNTVIVHVIPLSVLQLFPGLFKPEELLTESNLREIPATRFDIGIPETGFLKELTRMYAGLGKLYEKKNLTRIDVFNALNVRK